MVAFPNRIVHFFSYSKIIVIFWKFIAYSQLINKEYKKRKNKKKF
jgi:hypothetical protein